ncbi:family 1 glycosylhydrolase, partial [Enterococcus faecium]|uniref:family 1 glycosylhydrolase n=1 Tax=Enterococcus faecium TaxID=1352 RepID=UPI003CC6A5F4
FNRSFLDAAVKGEFPQEMIEIVKELAIMPEIHEGDLELIRDNTIDLLGINYYHPRRIKAKDPPLNHDHSRMAVVFFDIYDMPNK